MADAHARLRSTVRAYRLHRDTPSGLDYADRIAAAVDALPRACDLPPAGWACTREAGHDGACPTVAAGGTQ